MAEPGPAEAADLPIPARPGGLAIAAAIVAFGFVGSRLLGIVRTVAIARAFGSSPDLDAYFIAFRIPDLIFQVLAGATLGSAFIPVFARLYRRESEAAAWRLASHAINLVTTATAALCLVAFIFAPFIVPLLAPGLGDDIGRHAELTDKAVTLTRIMLLSPLLFAMSGMVTGILNGRQRFLLPAISPMLYNLAIIFGALVLADRWGVKGLAFGVVGGAALHLLVQVPGLFREHMKYQFGFGLHDPAVRDVARLMGPRVIGLAAAQFNFVVTGFFASKVGAAAISQLTYAWLLATLPLALFGMALSTAVFPRLADHAADADLDSLRQTVSRVLRVIMFLTIPAALGLAILREPATVVLLEHGEFTRIDSLFTASALGWYCLGIVPQAGLEIHSRGFYALGDTRTPVILAVSAVLLNVVVSALLWQRFEREGLAFSISLAAWCEWAALYFFYCRRTHSPAADDLRAIGFVAVAAGAMALFLAVTLSPLDLAGWRDNLVVAVAGGIAGAAVYAGAANWLRVPELSEALGLLRRRMGRDETDAG
jgi:putative peptidoglycan lipid II flippase